MGEEDAGVDEGGVAERREDLEEAREAGGFNEEAEERAGCSVLRSALRFEAAFFDEQADAAGGLAFEVVPGVAAHAAGDDDLRLAVGE